jgi:hypothetical protein
MFTGMQRLVFSGGPPMQLLNHSTILASLKATNNIYENLDNGDINVGTYMDFKKLLKLFEIMVHDILLHNMHCYGIRGTVLDWFRAISVTEN